MIFRKYLLFISIIFTALPSLALSSTKRLEEAFILFRITKTRGNTFYRVLIDRDETPYLNIKEVLEEYLDFTDVKCNPQRKYCQGVLQPKKILFWIDGQELQSGNSKGKIPTKDIPQGAFVVQEGKCWLRYDVWGDWLPADVGWDVSLYYLSLIPRFQLISERKGIREKRRLRDIIKREQKEKIKKTKPIKPSDRFDVQGRYQIEVQKLPNRDPLSSTSGKYNHDINIDVLTGTAQFGQSVFYQNKDANFSSNYWFYRMQDKKIFHLLEVGDTYFEESQLLIPNISVKTGLRIDSRKKEMYGEGKISVTDRAMPGTEVDLYRDGVYMGTTTVGPNGRYTFDNIVVTGRSRVKVRLFYPDGSEEERVIAIAEDSGLGLPKGKLEYRALIGETRYGRFNYLAVRYGLLDSLSIGLSPLLMPRSNTIATMTDMCLRPLSGINFIGQGVFTDTSFKGSSIDRGFKLNISLLYPNFFQFEHRFYNSSSPLLFSPTRTTGEYWAVRHSLGLGKWQLMNEYEQDLRTKVVGVYTMYAISRIIRPFIDYKMYWQQPSSSTREEIETGIDIVTSRLSRIRLTRTWTKPNRINTINFTLRSSTIDVGRWNIGATLIVPDKRQATFISNIMFRITKNLDISLLTNNRYVGFRLAWNDIVSTMPGPEHWNEFGRGILRGRVMSPSGLTSPPFPIEGAKVFVGNQSATTDKDGYYVISGIAPYEKLMFYIEPSSLEATMTTEKEFEVLYFRPGTKIEHSPMLVWTVGIDGVLFSDKPIPKGLIIEAINVPDMRLVSEGVVEEDGFFIIERLTPGKYILRVKGTPTPPKPIKIEIKEGEDWISGIEWTWNQ